MVMEAVPSKRSSCTTSTGRGLALAVLAGVIRPEGGDDADAMMQHAYLWDPLFLLWGGALVLSLRLSRRSLRAAR
jgi:hypothetical protein